MPTKSISSVLHQSQQPLPQGQAGQQRQQPTSPKPVNIFYVWYTELCRRLNMVPLNIVKPAKPKNETVLDFVVDRIKPEEWTPILNALRLDTSLHVLGIRAKVQCRFLDDITTEERAKNMKRRAGSLWTSYVLRNLVNSVAASIRRTSVLTCLELDGLPINSEYLQVLLDAMRSNTTIRILSLQHCPIKDDGCDKLCQTLRFTPNVEILNVSSCQLGASSAQAIANLVKFQQLTRYCASWHSSLRYEDPDLGNMAGLKRITLNNNPNIGDEGAQYILKELDDDLWIKAIDMQKCNITNSLASRLIEVVDYSRSLEIADFRNNDMLSTSVIQKIFDILKHKEYATYDSEFQWCATPRSSLPYQHSLCETATQLSSFNARSIKKSKSTPLKTFESGTTSHSLGLRRMNTSINIRAKNSVNVADNNRMDCLAHAKKQVLELNAQLQDEISRRVKTEAENRKLQNEIEAIKSNTLLQQIKNVKNTPPVTKQSNTTQQKHSESVKDLKNDMNKVYQKKNVEFVFSVDTRKKDSAQNMFENLLFKNVSPENESTSDTEFDEYFACEDMDAKSDTDDQEPVMSSGSNASLVKFMEEIKMRGTEKNVKVCPRNDGCRDNVKRNGCTNRILTVVR